LKSLRTRFNCPIISVGLILLFPTVHAFADCPAGQKTVFYCNTVNDKVIQLCDAGATIDYAFGRAGRAPELALRIPREQATTWQWPGIGRWMTYAVDVPNGDTRYSVFWGVDRLDEAHPVEAGVDVEIRGEHVATVKCSNDAALVQQMEGIDLLPRELP
jgi:hypothetical protein